MSRAAPRKGPWLLPAIATAAILASQAVGGAAASLGMAMGIAAAGFGVLGLWLLVGLLGRAVIRGLKPGVGTSLTILAFLAKIPVYVVLGGAADRIGGLALPFFVTGVVLVYFALVAWAACR